MKYPNLISRFNWRLMLIHFIAMWFFMYAFFILCRLHDLNAYEVFTKKWQQNSFDVKRYMSEIYWLYGSPYVGLLVAFIISLFISIKKKWFWLNSVIVFLIVYLLRRFDIDGWHYLKYIFLSPGDLFDQYSAGEYLVNGLPLLAIGLFLFFSKRINKFINGGSHISKSLPLASL